MAGWTWGDEGGALDFFYILGTKSPDTALRLNSHFSSVVLKRGKWVEVVWDGGADFALSEHSAISGDILGCHHRWCFWHSVETRDTAKQPSVHTTRPHNKESSSPRCHWCWGWERPALVYWIIKPSDSFFVVVLRALICKSQMIIISASIIAQGWQPN